MKRKIAVLLPLLIFLCFFVSCASETKADPSSFFASPFRHSVGFAINSAKGTAVIDQTPNGEFVIEYTGETSPYFGLRESFTESRMKTEFGGMTVEETEAFPLSRTVFELYAFLGNCRFGNGENTAINGIKAKSYRFFCNGGNAEVFVGAENGLPLKIVFSKNDDRIELNYSGTLTDTKNTMD